MDFNDLAAQRGADAVRSCIGKAIEGQPYPTPAAAKAEGGKSAGKPSQRDKLISIADRAEYWRCEEGSRIPRSRSPGTMSTIGFARKRSETG